MQSAYDKIQFYKLGKKEKERIIRKLKESLTKDSRIKFAVVFGSFTKRSLVRDVDVCIHAQPSLGFKELLNLNAQIELEIGVPVDLVEFDNLSPDFRMSILKTGTLIKGNKNTRKLLKETQTKQAPADSA